MFAPAAYQGTLSSLSGPMVESAISPQELLELAEICRDYVHRATGVALDHTPETLPVLDHYLSLARGNLKERPEIEPLVLEAAAAYFGEVVVRALNGFWVVQEERWQRVVGFRRVLMAISTTQAIQDAIRPGAAPRWLRLTAVDHETVERRLAALPPVSEEEFFLLSTKFEVLELAQESLLDPEHGCDYEPADYIGDSDLVG